MAHATPAESLKPIEINRGRRIKTSSLFQFSTLNSNDLHNEVDPKHTELPHCEDNLDGLAQRTQQSMLIVAAH